MTRPSKRDRRVRTPGNMLICFVMRPWSASMGCNINISLLLLLVVVVNSLLLVVSGVLNLVLTGYGG